MLTETIAAISTGGNNSGINIIRISGNDALKIIKRMFSNYKKLSHQKIIYGKVNFIDSNKMIDEVLVSYFKGPNSFTGEDICEINCHGGRKVTLQILNEVIKCGVRLATPGEFAKRAFLNGKMDLSKAEAIMELINAKTKVQSEIALSLLEGNLQKKIHKNREKLVETLAQIEVNIDYPEYDYEELSEENINLRLSEVIADLQELLILYNEGRYIKDGIKVAIIGATNVGKSSLLNSLVQEEKSIVTDIEGTTRDIVEDTVIIGDLVLNISDTAGIRETNDAVEKIGISKTFKALDMTDLVIYILDATKEITKKDMEMLKTIKQKNKPLIICINKIDISHETLNKHKKLKEFENIVEISALQETGIDALKDKIKHIFNNCSFERDQERIVVNERQKELLQLAKKHLIKALEDFKDGKSIDIISINIKEAITNLGTITGENATEDVINKIFEKFCLGK